MPRLKLLKYKKNRITLASYKVHHNSVFSYIKRAKSSTFGRESQVKAKYYGNPYKFNIEYIKIFGSRELSISELRSLNYVDNLYTSIQFGVKTITLLVFLIFRRLIGARITSSLVITSTEGCKFHISTLPIWEHINTISVWSSRISLMIF